MPCVDNLWEKCTWDFEFIVPRSLEQQDALSDDEDEDPDSEYPTVVICSGELVEQVRLVVDALRISSLHLFSPIPGRASLQLEQDYIRLLATYAHIRSTYRLGSRPIPHSRHPSRP